MDKYLNIRTLYVLLFLLTLSVQVQATHIRAGDLTAELISTTNPLTFRFTVMLYRDTDGVPAQPGLFEFGHNSATPTWVEPESLGLTQDGKTEILRYVITHTFPSAGTYKVSYYEQNRNPGVRNMFSSGNTAFFIESEFRVSPFFGLNSSPRLLYLPVDQAIVGQRYIHNPGAYDPDGDSLSYRITVCKLGKDDEDNALEVNEYRFPDDPGFNGVKEDGTGDATFTINPVTGDIIWDAPGEPGEYNVAFYVDEWRGGILIGTVNRDMQIIVVDGENTRPRLMIPRDTCVIAGQTLIDTIKAEDSESNFIELSGEGGLFENNIGGIDGGHDNKATFTVRGLQPPNGYEEGVFEWNTICTDVRKEPYQATFRARDVPTSGNENDVSLVDLQTWLIRVVGPPPDSLEAEPDLLNNSVALKWADYICDNADTMTIWRRKGSFDFTPEPCETGIPDYTGYRKIGDVPIGQTAFIDNNNGQGLDRGVTYCYRIYATFPGPEGGESIASTEVCVFIPQLAPYLVEVSVEETDRSNGSIDLTWTHPIELDTVKYPRPLTYTLTRADGLNGSANRTDVGGIFNEDDTTYTDTGIDTERLPYNYTVNLFSQGAIVDTSSSASSIDLSINPRPNSLNLVWEADVPWSNASNKYPYHYIFREDPSTGDMVLIDSVDVTQAGLMYTDSGKIAGFPLVEDEEYCYKVMTMGTYENSIIREPLPNYSQIACAVLRDTIAPCPPTLSIDSLDCTDVTNIKEDQNESCFDLDTLFSNRLSWQPDLSGDCDTDISSYNLYYSPRPDGELELIASNILGTTYLHENISSVAGCYAVTALDPNGNESDFSNLACNDNCPEYVLPNVFTPNGDGVNDTFVPFKCVNFVKDVEIKISNRWGQEVFTQKGDIYINWDGTDQSGKKVGSGVYYYVAIIRFVRLNEDDEIEERKGYIQVTTNVGE
ncbi:gliding motility-associated C-terminal domain-containing protein [Flammeovirgaceae bacterium SG7u.111]|nr:gliding motility-associated C-terminal domain-containing protein [Flammeovirgaceae bacterium SG7u.132]WPO37966.1 gliding motility-associated C-terminal domain-containing protein [Flammeovirgaceae bacterium SG7u.111]